MRLLTTAFLLALTGCASDSADRYYADPYSRSARDPSQVEVLLRRPERPFRVVADFQARRASVDYMREKAAAVGADAVIIARIGGAVRNSSRTTDRNEGFREESENIYGHLTGTAIIYE